MTKEIDLTDEILAEMAGSGYVSVDDQGINRIEVIGMDGREFVRYLKDDERMLGVLQDDNRTLKIFIEDNE